MVWCCRGVFDLALGLSAVYVENVKTLNSYITLNNLIEVRSEGSMPVEV